MAAALLRHAGVEPALDWLRARGAQRLASDSRRLRPGDAFIAWPGHALDARRFVGDALAAGAAACLVEARGAEAFGFDDERIAALDGLKAAAGELASRWFGEPSRALEVVAITGTNGKTSTAWWIAQALGASGQRAGVIGTLGVGEPPRLEPGALTTPDPIALQSTLRRFADARFAACAVEASSIGLVEERLAGTRIAVAVFTNFTQDHLDYHGDMAAYWDAKARLFAWPGLRAAVINIDDERGAALAAGPLGAAEAWTTSTRDASARLCAHDIVHHDGGLAFEVREGARAARVQSALIGEFNVANLLAVIGSLRALGVTLEDAARACARLGAVPGRMQRIEAGDDRPQVVIDYAHTPDALEKVLLALQPFARGRGGALWCVFGCGGERDAAKRPLMGAIAERLAQRVVVTSDNPRGESPSFILSQILAGVVGHDDVDVIEDRAEAIRHAVTSAAARDVVLIAGKGHEDHQEVAGVRRPFSDAGQARAALAARAQP